MNYIGLDIGSTSIKGSVLDLQQGVVGQAVSRSSPEPVSGQPTGFFEVDPAAILATTCDVLDSLLALTPDCEGIVATSQMGGVVLANDDRQPLTNYLSWRDQRVLDHHSDGDGTWFELVQSRLTDDHRDELGQELKPGTAPAILTWLLETGQLPIDNVIPLAIGDLILAQLCESEPVSEATNALGVLNLKTGDWHHEVLDRLGLSSLRWPRISSPTVPLGHRDVNGLSIPVFPAIGDHQCSLLGTLMTADEVSINISTGSQIGLLTNTFAPGDYQIRPYFDGQLLNTITHLPAGRSLNVLVDLLMELVPESGEEPFDPWTHITKAIDAAGESDLDVDLAFFAGPMGERGSIGKISVDNLNVGTLFRSAFAGMADNYQQCAGRLAKSPTWSRAVLAGGLSRKLPVLRNMIADRLQCPIRVAAATEETFTGLMVLALVASGTVGTFEAASDHLRG